MNRSGALRLDDPLRRVCCSAQLNTANQLHRSHSHPALPTGAVLASEHELFISRCGVTMSCDATLASRDPGCGTNSNSDVQLGRLEMLLKPCQIKGISAHGRENHQNFGSPFGSFCRGLLPYVKPGAYVSRRAWTTVSFMCSSPRLVGAPSTTQVQTVILSCPPHAIPAHAPTTTTAAVRGAASRPPGRGGRCGQPPLAWSRPLPPSALASSL
jgi:hypothetical protein